MRDPAVRGWGKSLEERQNYDAISWAFGITNFLEPRGFFEVIRTVGPRQVEARAAVYLVNHKPSTASSEPDQQALIYDGAITICRTGQIPGTNHTGRFVELNGQIWMERPADETPTDELFEAMILGNSEDVGNQGSHLTAIVRGFRNVEQEILQRESAHSLDSYARGASDAAERSRGTFGMP